MTQKEQIKDERYWSFLFQSLKGYIDIYPLSQKASPEKYSNNRGQKTSISSILKQLQMAPNPKAVVVRAHIACSQRERTSGLSSPLSLLIYMKVDLLSSTVIYLSDPLRLYSQSSSLESMPISDLTPLGVKQFIAIVKRQKAIRYVIKSERMLAEVTTQTSTIARVKVHRRWMCGAMEFIKVQRILCILLQTLPTVMIQYFYFESQSNCQGFIIQDVFGLFRMQIQCCLYIYKYFYVLLSFSFQNKPSIFVFELSRLDDSQTRLSFSKFFISFYNATVRLMILQWIYFSESNYIFKITLQQCQILLLYFQVELDLFPDLHKLLFRNKQNQMSKRIQTVSIPIIAYHNLYYIKFLTHMEQTVQQYDVPPPNYKPNEHATHGFSHRPSLAQITSFLVISFTIAVYFSCVMSIHQNLTLLILYCTTLAVIIVSSAQASLTNPTDRVVYYYKWSRHDKKVTFSPEYNKILFCQFCDSYCFANSKHCRTCNRCVDKFDHHCMWFNNCVGQRNYNYFFVSILSTFFYSVIFIAHVVLSSIKTNYGDRQQLTKIVFGWIGALIMAIFGFLLFNLIALHFYLIATEQTTYQFLQKRKKEEQEQKKKLNQQRQQQQKMANNKVMPEHNPQHEAVSQQSIASNNIVLVRRNEEQQDAKTDHLNKGFPVNKKIENSKIEMTYVHKQLIFNEALSVQSKGNLIDQREHEQIQSIMKDNGKSLPKFFGKNRSLKYMFPQMQAQSPSKSRKNLSDLVLRQV